MGKIDIYEVLSQCRSGELEAYKAGDGVYLEDKETGDRVRICTVPEAPTGRPSRVENMFGPRETWGANNDDGQGPYRGFLMIRCEGCGKVHAYCAKKETYVSHCECGYETPLENLRVMHMHCKCGMDFRYKTNLTDKYYTHECLDCKAPVDMELNSRETAYVTIGYRR